MAAIVAVAATVGGCSVRVYQPMSGLHRPVVVDPRHPNLRDTHLDVHCVPGELLNHQQAGVLCERMRALFQNQGAQVATYVSAGRSDAALTMDVRRWGEPEPDPAVAERTDAVAEPSTRLTVELRAREVHTATHPLSWVLCVGSFTLLPGVTEQTFAQEVVIRDARGSVLLTDRLQGRLVQRFGAGAWLGNAILDLSRDDDEKLGGDRAARDLSADLYTQLSQLVFNARLQAVVLQEQGPSGPAAGAR